jgi:hypothetical protein
MIKVCPLFVLVPVLALAAGGGLAQEKKPAAGPAAMEAPKPGPEHKILADDVGTWDATVEMWMAPGAAPVVSKGVEKVRMLGGFWQVSDFEGTFMGQPFQGLGQVGYDPAKKKYVSTWIDTWSTAFSNGEATYDSAAKTMTGAMEMPGQDGKLTKVKETTVWKGDTRVFTMSAPGPDGKEVPTMRITYTRRK